MHSLIITVCCRLRSMIKFIVCTWRTRTRRRKGRSRRWLGRQESRKYYILTLPRPRAATINWGNALEHEHGAWHGENVHSKKGRGCNCNCYFCYYHQSPVVRCFWNHPARLRWERSCFPINFPKGLKQSSLNSWASHFLVGQVEWLVLSGRLAGSAQLPGGGPESPGPAGQKADHAAAIFSGQRPLYCYLHY